MDRYISLDDVLALRQTPGAYGMDISSEDVKRLEPADVVPWSFLENYAAGRRHNFDSDFILGAKQVWEGNV